MARPRHGNHRDEHARLLAEHVELLESSVREQLGPLAGSLVRALNRHGALTLRELADAVKREPFGNPLSTGDAARHVGCPLAVPAPAGEVGTDAAIKELMARLVLHRVVCYDAERHVYGVALGYGLLLRTLFPLVLRFFQRRYGETGVTLLMVFHQLATVPWEAALRLATERRPALSEALRHCAREMERLGLVEFVSAGRGGVEEAAAAPTATLSPDPCRLHVGNILAEMLHDAIQHQLLAERFADGGVAAAVVEAFTTAGRGRRLEERAPGFPPVHPRTSVSLPLRVLLREVPLAEAAVVATVSRMCRPDGEALLSNDGTAAVAVEGPYRFRYDAAIEAMQRDCCERLVFARHGVLGVRLTKLLLQHHNMEDRMLAEEAIATLPRTREVLHAMLRDGYVRQQEVPKSGVMADRQPKNSVFLWGCSLEKDLLPAVRAQVAKALRITLARLSQERKAAANEAASFTAAAAAAASGVAGAAPGAAESEAACPAPAAGVRRATGEVTAETLRSLRAVAALESSASALMGTMLVLDFY
ncbi:uncharacterized protein Tco025E_00353 [Trypanosoma conorhini]|uniref:DNA-directed RNA polymerase III subunit RPC3 n=1 Tax=Trypanosoma conorhini TaxID=83891 RepID=A0A3R7P1N0_9TRYP|nr:uncharacterized protein Tco025E_00353 [Trypanosoma conorhini]RNF27423.1 hypothetical protein Tco025E_00353 [Trypanosoma conorhini]